MKVRHVRRIALLAATCILATALPGVAMAGPKHSGPGDSWGQFVKGRTGMLEELATPIENCFPLHDRTDAGSPMFDGCYDWHSAVHAAYSLHVLYGVTGDRRYLAAAEAKIKPEKVADELAYMRTTIANRENPYGFSWLLALVKEREQVTGKRDLRPLADEAVARIRALIESLTPEQAQQRVLVPNYPNVSWALIHLQLWADYTRDRGLASFVDDHTESILLDPALDALCPVTADATADNREFFPPCLMRLAAVSQTWDAPHATVRRWVRARIPAGFTIEPVSAPVRVHSYALNFSRAYALWHIWKATDDVRYRDNYTSLLNYQVSRPELWSLEAGYDVSHWVAQFGVRAIDDSSPARRAPRPCR